MKNSLPILVMLVVLAALPATKALSQEGNNEKIPIITINILNLLQSAWPNPGIRG